MTKQTTTEPRLCVLTQTATEPSPYYHEFFSGLDLFFVTFKRTHPAAVDFLPGSTWSDGRNRLWEHVKGEYDYYLFVDDDLEFSCLPPGLPTSLEPLLQKRVSLQEKLRLRGAVSRVASAVGYREADPARFRKRLFDHLDTYRPQVATFARVAEPGDAGGVDRYALARNRHVRPLGWFDAQATIFSDVAARLLLPYDTGFSGWWSSQIPIYLLAYLAFKGETLSILDLATKNDKHLVYRPGYDGVRDCLDMSGWLSKGILDADCPALDLEDGSFIDLLFGSESAKTEAMPGKPDPTTLEGALTALGRSFDLHHPYIYERHKDLVDALDAERAGKATEKIHG